MKLGIFISIAFVAILTTVVILKLMPRADPPTAATRAEKLKEVSLGEDMPRLYEVTDVDANAAEHYDSAVAYFARHRDDLQRGVPSDRHADALAGHLIAAMHAGRVPDGFLDEGTPIAVGLGQNSHELSAVAAAVIKVLETRYEDEALTRADQQTALALFALGERAFRKNVLLANRHFGLSLMIDSGGYMGAIALETDGRTPDQLNEAGDAVNRVIDAWTPKLRVVMTTDPHVGDLLRVAREDEDRSFRIAATTQLGIAKFTDGNPGNRRAIASFLAKAKQSEDPMIARAAEAADSLTIEQFRTLR